MIPAGPPGTWDPEQASPARMHNYLLDPGPYGNYGPPDQAAAEQILEACPQARVILRDSRLFAARAAGWAAAEGIAQFIDLGCGNPPGETLHDIARSVRPGAAVAYADLDAEVLSEIGAQLTGHDRDGTALVRADFTDPEAVLGDPALKAVIDVSAPVAVSATMVLHFTAPDDAAKMVAGYMGRLPEGSLFAVSVPRLDRVALAALRDLFAPVQLHDYGPGDVANLLRGLEMVPPGIAKAACLHPGHWAAPRVPRGGAYAVAGIGRKRTGLPQRRRQP